MIDLIFKTHYNSVPSEPELLTDDYCIDPTGYIPAKRQIENMLYAGAMLDQSRREDYDFNGDDELEYRKEFDVRRPDFDRVDAVILLSELHPSGEVAAAAGSDDGKSSDSPVSDSGSGESGAAE